jgi:hypothetical protein
MRWGASIVLACGLLASSTRAGGASRNDCLDACAVLIAHCATTCDAFADLNGACRRGVLKRCRREGVEVCASSTSTTVTTTTAVVSSTTHATTTTTHGPTSSTTIPNGLDCSNPTPLTIGTTVDGDTSRGQDHGPGLNCMQNAQAPDLVYVVVPDTDGTLVLSLTSDWDGGLYVRTTCDDPSSELACEDVLGENATEVLQLPVTGGVTYYVYVDGYTSDSYGPYELTSDLQ